MEGRKNKLNAITHLLVSFALVLKGLDKLSHGHPVIGSILLAFGLIILFYFIYLARNKKHSVLLDDLVHLFEALAALFVAYIYYNEGSNYLHYVFLVAALGFFIAIYVSRKKRSSFQ